jgi:hypothetical protein
METYIAVGHEQAGGEPHKWHKPIGMPEPQMRWTGPDFPLIARNVSDGLETEFIFTRFLYRWGTLLLGSRVRRQFRLCLRRHLLLR